MKSAIDHKILNLLNEKIIGLEAHFDADVIGYFGSFSGGENLFRDIVEDLADDPNKKDRINIVLTTGGGSANVVERFVFILREHYQEVNFIVPDYAYSAGTIFCMSGDNIYMDYFSVLGPIDPQVQNRDGRWVAALGYLDKINELIAKAQSNTLTQAEFMILKEFDLAELKGYEQAKDLTISLLEKWLVKYKFKNWDVHRTNPLILGQPVTEQQKIEKVIEIGGKLSDNKRWKTHGRPINIEALRELGLEIEDYGANRDRKKLIREYHELLSDYVIGRRYPYFINSRKYI
jgi:hypothetical protein